jgi:hypothetical protein
MLKQYSGVLERFVKHAELAENQFARVGSGETPQSCELFGCHVTERAFERQ